MKKHVLIMMMLYINHCNEAKANVKANTQAKTTEKWYLWSSTRNEWYLEYLNTNRYNESNHRISGTHFNVLENKFVSKDTLIFENERLFRTIDYLFNNQSKTFIPESMIESLYDENNIPVGNLSHVWENGNWKPSNGARFVYYTNSGLNFNSQTFETYNSSTNQWEKKSKVSNEYFPYGNLKIWSDSVYDSENQVFVPRSRTEHEGWIAPNHPTRAIDKRYVNGVWRSYNEITSSVSGENYIKIINDINNENFDIKSVTAKDGSKFKSYFLYNNEWKIMREIEKNDLNTVDYHYHYADDRSLFSISKIEKRYDQHGNMIANEMFTKFPANASTWELGEGTLVDMLYDSTGRKSSMTVKTYDFYSKKYVNNYKVEYFQELDTIKQKPQFVLNNMPAFVTLSGENLEIDINYSTNSTGDIVWSLESFDGDIASIMPNSRISIKSAGTITLSGYSLENRYFTNSDTATAIIKIVRQNTTSTQGNEADKMILYPNPANDIVYINTSNTTNMILNIKDSNGKNVQNDVNGNMFSIRDLASGIYFVEIQTQNTTIVKRLIKL